LVNYFKIEHSWEVERIKPCALKSNYASFTSFFGGANY